MVGLGLSQKSSQCIHVVINLRNTYNKEVKRIRKHLEASLVSVQTQSITVLQLYGAGDLVFNQ